MKKLFYILLVIAAMSCADEDTVQMGCQTGILKGTTQRLYIRCCTREQHLAGANEAAGGSAAVSSYSNLEWTAIDKCENCK
jgi:hypothetical protein